MDNMTQEQRKKQIAKQYLLSIIYFLSIFPVIILALSLPFIFAKFFPIDGRHIVPCFVFGGIIVIFLFMQAVASLRHAKELERDYEYHRICGSCPETFTVSSNQENK